MLDLNIEIQGEGDCVVFLHGFLESNLIWNSILPHLNCKCISVDLPGHGKSNGSIKSISHSASLIANELDKIGIEKYTVVGHSLGGYIALELAEQTEKCQHVVLLNSNFWTDSEEKKKDRNRVAQLVLKHKDFFISEAIPALFVQPERHTEEIQELLQEAKGMNAESIADCSISMSKRNDFTNWITEKKNTVSIIQGEYDAIVPERIMLEKIEKVTIKNLYKIKSGHMSWCEQRDLIIELLNKIVVRD